MSADSGTKWKNRSKGLVTSMFYDIDVAQSDARMFGGGMEDNGTNITFEGRADDLRRKRTAATAAGSLSIRRTRRSTTQRPTIKNMSRHRGKAPPKSVTPPAKKAEKDKIWMMFLDMDPNDPSTVFAGGLRVWRTRTAGDTWKAVTDELDESPITAVEVARDSKTIISAPRTAASFAAATAARTGVETSPARFPASPSRGFTQVRAMPRSSTRRLPIRREHVDRSDNAGRTWTDIDRHRLPDVPHHAIAIPARNPSTVFVCNDAGVFVSTDAGDNWRNLTGKLPNVQIVDLVYHDRDGTLFAASYGRGLWRLDWRNN